MPQPGIRRALADAGFRQFRPCEQPPGGIPDQMRCGRAQPAGLRWHGRPTRIVVAKETPPCALHAISCAIAAATIIATSAPAAAFNCYLIVDRTNEVVYQDRFAPVDLSDDGAPARDAIRARGQQLIVMDTEYCPAIDRARVTGQGGPASVEEIVAGMRSAARTASAAAGHRPRRRIRRPASYCRASRCRAPPAAACRRRDRRRECRSGSRRWRSGS